MIPITVAVPENKLIFFKELVKSLNFIEIDAEEKVDFEIPQWHKSIIDQRLKEYEQNPTDVLNWDEVKDTFKLR